MKTGLAIVAAAALLAAKPHAGKTIRPIAVVLNGSVLSVNPPPRFYRYHLLVPVRRIIESLGLAFEHDGRNVTTHVGAKEVTLRIGSTQALVDGEPVELDAAPVEIKNTLFAPLRFFSEALDAQAYFDRQTNSVEIVSSLVGRTQSVTSAAGGTSARGTVTAVDVDSSPPTVTLTLNASVHTFPIDPAASVLVQDVNSGTSNPGELADIHVGDWAQIALDRRGRAKQVVDAFGSRAGVVSAAASGAIVLEDGHVINPSRATTITLNGANVTIDKLRIGDEVTVRYNIDTSEPRQIIATRATSETSQPAGAAAIQSITFAPDRPLRKGATLFVTLRGTGAGTASFDIGPYVTDIPMKETSAGIYSGTYKVRAGINIVNAPLFGHLNARGATAAATSESLVSIATEPPGIEDFAPASGAAVNNSRPAIYATFAAGVVPVNASSARMEVNGREVTSSSTRTARFIEYLPSIDYGDGPVRVTVRVADEAGNTTTKSWTFFIKSRH